MLVPKNLQCRVIAALLNGHLPKGYSLEQLESLYRDFDEPWRNYMGPLLDAMEIPEGVSRATFINGYVGITSEHRSFAFEEAGRVVDVPALDKLELPEIEWLWKGWIPRGMLTLFGAMPSAGKSYVALDLARRVIEGTSFPDGTPVVDQGSVIYVDAENAPQIHNRRAIAWGMDRSQLYLMRPEEDRLMIDLTDEYVRAGEVLCEWVGLEGRISLERGDATATPYAPDSFDKSFMIHVGMNIADKESLAHEMYRVLKPGGRIGVYDVMRAGEGPLRFPVPWATTPAESRVTTPDVYREALEEAGFRIVADRDRSEFALEFFSELQERAAGPEDSPLGLHLLMGESAAVKVQNMIDNIAEGCVAPFEIIAEKPA